jgi:polyisoprenoid-binding protein YceI
MTQELIGTGLVAGTWNIDPAHSEVGFTVRHLMSKVRGSFADFSGTITTTEDPAKSTVSVTIKTASINTNNEQRDGHLRSTDFFDAEKGGELVFVSTGITAEDGGYVIHGDLTINGISKPVDLAAEFLGVASDAYGATRLGAEATTTINRKDFKVDFNIPLDGGKFLIGDKIDITLSIEATKA